jgi:hypothetical protein
MKPGCFRYKLQVKDTRAQTAAILEATAKKLGRNSTPDVDNVSWHALQSLLALGEPESGG